MILLPLGTNGFLPSGGRQTMSFLLRIGERELLLDAGTGVSRLLEPGLRGRAPRPARLDVVLSHYHLDHVVGLSYLPAVARGTPVRIFAPAPPLTDAGPEALARLLEPPLFPSPPGRWPMPVEIVPYGGDALEAGDLRFATRRQLHPGGSVGFRLGDALAYVTDTAADPATTRFVSGVGTLLHEVWTTAAEAGAEAGAESGHSSVVEVAEIARAAGVGALVPIHHRPGRSSDELREIVAELGRRSGVPVRLPIEGEPLELPG